MGVEVVKKNATFDIRRSTFDLSVVARRLSIVLFLLMALKSLAIDNSISPAFTFDARYEPSGLSPDSWASYQAEGLSSRFTAMTVLRARDDNKNGIPDAWDALYGLEGDFAAADADPDGDGRSNREEYNAGTNPSFAEDYSASISISSAYTVDTWIDSIADGYGTLVEVWGLSSIFLVDTAGRAPDTDKDGIPDWFEKLYGLNLGVVDSHLDYDGDGRTNREEYNAGTNPILVDDWTKSAAESLKSFITDTRVWYTSGNPSFGDGFAVVKVSKGFICDTGGLYYDWDGDGIPNWWEARFSRGGSKTGLLADIDDDGDGQSNYGEFVAYSDPTNSLSKFVIGYEQIVVKPIMRNSMRLMAKTVNVNAENADYALTWNSALGRIYSVYVTDNIAKGWPSEPVVELEGTGEEIQYVPERKGNAQFYRVSVRLADNLIE